MRTRLYYLWNIGCQMNRADALRVSEALEQRGFAPTRRPALADIVLLNTCVVRQSAEDKVVARLDSLRPLKAAGVERALLLMGCFVHDDAELLKRFPHVDATFAPSDIAGVTAFVDQWTAAHAQERDRAPESGSPDGQQSAPLAAGRCQVSELVPVSYGCDHHCTYCIVTLRRGAQRSRPVAEIVEEVRRLVARGAREVTLLGQNVDAYGSDLAERPDLADMLRAAHDIEGLWRIRFLTSHPRDLTPRIIDTVVALPQVCPCWELPVQSGDDDVLRRMARGYTAAHYRELVGRLRAATPDCAINTDVIVGFPSETAEQFERTRQLVCDMRFDMLRIAAYSVRAGTAAANWADDVSPEEKERRRALLEQLQTRISAELNARLMGQEVEILVDGRQRGRWRGRTRGNRLVFFESADDRLGQLVRVRITWTGPWSMIGEAC